ncbi:MAG: hypothetical protein CMF22_11610 [Idiomarinaceae bacterium]|nr:hypothetical protein [Idiomarinaceae bacterium]|tara:strand:- start:71615 stop:72304 length:690 start_codon:yes stop_codon:yes gene_type:complete
MKNLNEFKEISEIFEGKELIHHSDTDFECPVCGKHYKTEKGAIKHLSSRSCAKKQDIFGGSMYESNAFIMYTNIVHDMKPNARVTIKTFRKSPMYGLVIDFVLSTSLFEIKDRGLYFSYLRDIRDLHPNSALKAGTEETNAREFRTFLQVYPKYVDSAKFFGQYGDDLIEDDEFLVRSIEKSDITLRWLMDCRKHNFEKMLDELPIGLSMRIDAVVTAMSEMEKAHANL